MAAILQHPLVREDPGSSEIIRNVVQRGGSNSNLRIGMDTLEMALFFKEGSSEMLYTNPSSGRYRFCRYENLPPIVAMTVTGDNNIYVLAEVAGTEDWLSFLVYNHLGNTWEQRSSVQIRVHIEDCDCRSEHLVEVFGHLYYLGCAVSGTDEEVVVMKRYNQYTDQWHICSTPCAHGEPFGLSSNVALSCGPHIYLFTRAEMLRYDPSDDQWCRLTLPIAIHEFWTAVAMGTEIFYTSLDLPDMLVYDTQSESWSELPRWANTGQPDCVGPCLFVLQNQLHVLTCFRSLDSGRHMQISVCDRSARVWRDLDVPLPEEDWFGDDLVFPVARMYQPCLNTS
ncbi:uncharacterized protein [Branchiostoma lanceolatum]|uniref:uncharacterized protein n=1 Tax=Branchiostoma lanceolatum TaxID=7740 RepID=UPI00345649F5